LANTQLGVCLCGTCTFWCSFRLTFVEKVVKRWVRYMRFGVGRSLLDSRPFYTSRNYLERPTVNDSRRFFQVSLRHSWRFGANDAAFLRRFLPSCSDPPCQQATACKRRVIPSLVEVLSAPISGFRGSREWDICWRVGQPHTKLTHLLRMREEEGFL